MSDVTFIIPTIGRPTLNRTLNSLLALQGDFSWKALVAYDGISIPENILQDERIAHISVEKTGTTRQAGTVRNSVFNKVTTSWLAFVDDDDSLVSRWGTYFQEELKNKPDLDIIIFRMIYTDGLIYPVPGDRDFKLNEVGISFAIKKEFIDKNNIRFVNSPCEDYDLLNYCRSIGAKYTLSEKIAYLVRPQ
jgi:hypothetical protein